MKRESGGNRNHVLQNDAENSVDGVHEQWRYISKIGRGNFLDIKCGRRLVEFVTLGAYEEQEIQGR